MNAANRVTINTSVLYARMVITTGITLYTTRVVLNAFLRFLITLPISSILFAITVYLFDLAEDEKTLLNNFAKKIKVKFIKK